MAKQLTILLLFISSISFGQTNIKFDKKSKEELQSIRQNKKVNLSGLWEAEISQQNYNGAPEFAGVYGKLHVEITHKGNLVKGLIVCRAKFAKQMGYLSYEKTFKGLWDGENLAYQDTEVEHYINTHREMRHLETCLKTATLSYYVKDGKAHLEGDWSGKGHVSDVECIPGKIHFTKVLDDELVLEEAQTYNVNFASLDKGPVEVKWNRKNKVKKLKNRKVEAGKVVKVNRDFIRISVYDHKRDDGDIISLNYNGNWILQKHELDHAHHELDVFVSKTDENPNYLILYAHNLGQFPPNTVAVLVDDGVQTRKFILNSDMNTSDVLYFVRED